MKALNLKGNNSEHAKMNIIFQLFSVFAINWKIIFIFAFSLLFIGSQVFIALLDVSVVNEKLRANIYRYRQLQLHLHFKLFHLFLSVCSAPIQQFIYENFYSNTIRYRIVLIPTAEANIYFFCRSFECQWKIEIRQKQEWRYIGSLPKKNRLPCHLEAVFMFSPHFVRRIIWLILLSFL